MRANERTEERVTQCATRRFHSHPTQCGWVVGLEVGSCGGECREDEACEAEKGEEEEERLGGRWLW